MSAEAYSVLSAYLRLDLLAHDDEIIFHNLYMYKNQARPKRRKTSNIFAFEVRERNP